MFIFIFKTVQLHIIIITIINDILLPIKFKCGVEHNVITLIAFIFFLNKLRIIFVEHLG